MIDQRYAVRQNIISVIGVCLSLYFSYHLIAGERSYLRLMSLQGMIEKSDAQLAEKTAAREQLEQRVVMMRPGSISRDLLEEEARAKLGFRYEGEKIVILPPGRS